MRDMDRLRVQEIVALRKALAELDAVRKALKLKPASGVDPPIAEYNEIVEWVRALDNKIERLHERTTAPARSRVRNAAGRNRHVRQRRKRGVC
jgi:DNA-binding transcriptional MerR regulator